MASPLQGNYEALTAAAKVDLKGAAVTKALLEVVLRGLDFLSGNATPEPLTSKVPDKEYFDFHLGASSSRPINKALFDFDTPKEVFDSIFAGKAGEVEHGLLSRALYTAAMAYCATTDLTKSGDQKTPGTYFECFIGHLVAQRYGVNPDKQTQVPSLEIINSLPTDYVFDLGTERRRIHLPIKTSTRERVVQVWAHQRVLDGIHGRNRFRGLLACLAETNKQTRERAVVEVCLPGQWAVYQMHIAELHRVYYLDIPAKYVPLKDTFPHIYVTTFADFFAEADQLVAT